MSLPTAPASAAATAGYSRLAHQILGERRFQEPPLPRPLHGVLDALGGALAPLGEAISDVFNTLAGVLPGGSASARVLIAVAIIAIAAVVATRITDRTLAARASTLAAREDEPRARDAHALDAAADAAERAGLYAQALRLRFQAGLLRLDELGVLAWSPSVPNSAVSRRLRSSTFDALARRFEEVAYGCRPAEPGEAARARDAWRRVIGEVRER